MKHSIDDSSINLNQATMTVYKDEATNDDGSGWASHISNANLSDANDWYTGSGPNGGRINLADSASFSGNYNSELGEIRDFMKNNEVNIYFVDVKGRIKVQAD